MIFEGKVDEGEVDKLEIGMPLEISLGAIEDKKFDAKLKFIAPKGTEEAGRVLLPAAQRANFFSTFTTANTLERSKAEEGRKNPSFETPLPTKPSPLPS